MRSHQPTSEEFFKAVRQSFGYLRSDYGFVEEPIVVSPSLHLAFSGEKTRIVVEGRDWGLNARVALGHAGNIEQFENYDLKDLIDLRPTRFRLCVPRGNVEVGSYQLEQIGEYAIALRSVGEDFLRGSTGVFAELQRVVDERRLRLAKAPQ